jgi:hypothetical protein
MVERKKDEQRVRVYADLDISIDTAMRVACARARVSRKQFLEGAILREISYAAGAHAQDTESLGRRGKKG